MERWDYPDQPGPCWILFKSSFIGNLVYGGRTGVEPNGAGTIYPYTYNCSGNYMNLYPFLEPTPTNNPDGPGYVAGALGCQLASVCGNTLASNGSGFMFWATNTAALILNNDFSQATYRGIGYAPIGISLNVSMENAQVYGNKLSEGV